MVFSKKKPLGKSGFLKLWRDSLSVFENPCVIDDIAQNLIDGLEPHGIVFDNIFDLRRSRSSKYRGAIHSNAVPGMRIFLNCFSHGAPQLSKVDLVLRNENHFLFMHLYPLTTAEHVVHLRLMFG